MGVVDNAYSGLLTFTLVFSKRSAFFGKAASWMGRDRSSIKNRSLVFRGRFAAEFFDLNDSLLLQFKLLFKTPSELSRYSAYGSPDTASKESFASPHPLGMALPSGNYIISRNANEAARLDLQHRCYMSCQGYYLHPSIPLSPTNARIADLATGTGIWIREVAFANPDIECRGFDISDFMFPSRESLPENLQLHIADVKQPFDDRWLSYFDVVHIRLIQAAMRIDEWSSVLRNITKLLKPRGWLQWVEDDRAVAVRRACRPVAPLEAEDPSMVKTDANQWQPPRVVELAHFNRHIMPDDRAAAMNYGYMNLDVLFADPGVGNLESIDTDTFMLDRTDDGGKLRRDWATMGISAAWNMVKAREDLGARIANIGRDEWANRAEKEIDEGAHYVCRSSVFVGRKRL